MLYDTLHTFVFSPTGTGRRTADAIARGFGAANRCDCDLAHCEASPVTLPRESAALFVVPVYGGRVAPAALRRLGQLRGDRTPAVLVVLYGNRSAGRALRELEAAVCGRGFVPVAAAACVGEHSYSSHRWPIAAGRPDADDLARAEAFGCRTADLLARTEHPAAYDCTKLRLPRNPLLATLRFARFVLRYRRARKRDPRPLLPVTDAARCTACGRCVALCPAEAIAPGDELHTDPARCIRCCACVKGCPAAARSYDSPFAPVLSRLFRQRKPDVFSL
ncbi:4Fe-4S binding protein [uncultured Alistipes sp.]|uniref:4Fe-4S binding protein n=1 Tax=uncultured Alistipes sp. TaxID=538949 RepID=UPI00262337AD|nr:4Fe-4S binding protein [uncultured Alistipes sp.]